MIHVVDAMMGMGKTSAAIQYMKDNAATKRFLFITPYIEEADRVKSMCCELDFVSPIDGIKEYGYTKSSHLMALAKDGRNIAMSHKLFSLCSPEAIDMIRAMNYTVIIDEVMEVFEKMMINDDDFDILRNSGWLIGHGVGENSDYVYYEQAADKRYHGRLFHDLFVAARSHRLVNISDEDTKNKFYYWTLDHNLFHVSSDVFILTYLFDGSPMKAFLEINGLAYDYIGVERNSAGEYHFSSKLGIPEYAGRLSELLHVCDHDRLNDIGNNKHALSASWWRDNTKRADGKSEIMRKNLSTFFRYHSPSKGAEDRLWCTFNGCRKKVRGKGYSNSCIAMNARATNDYRDRIALAYCVNVFADPNMMAYFVKQGSAIDQDKYALSFLVQWIWRSAIRDGKEVWVYVPSSRMRKLLLDWISSVEEQYQEYKRGGLPKEVA